MWLPLAGGVEHTKAVLATQGILELFLQSRGLPSLGILAIRLNGGKAYTTFSDHGCARASIAFAYGSGL